LRFRTVRGLPCCARLPSADMPLPLPRRKGEGPALDLLRPASLPCVPQVGFRVNIFEACSAFTRVTACRLASPAFRDLSTEGSGGFVASSAAPIATGWSASCQAGFPPAENRRLSRRTGHHTYLSPLLQRSCYDPPHGPPLPCRPSTITRLFCQLGTACAHSASPCRRHAVIVMYGVPGTTGTTGTTAQNYGPYYEWTFKQDGRTVTVNLSASQQRHFRRAIERQRRLAATLDQMRAISREFLEATTKGVSRRKPRR